MNIPKKQHYIPRFYLEGFCKSKCDYLYVYDLKRGVIRKSKPIETAKEKNFYCFDVNGEPSYDLEKAIETEIETPASLAIQKYTNTMLYTAAEKNSIAKFM